MDHYTYLLGAGASAPTLPVNKGLLKRLHDIITLGPNHLNELKYQSYLRYFKNTFTPIINEARREISIDTFGFFRTSHPIPFMLDPHLKIKD